MDLDEKLVYQRINDLQAVSVREPLPNYGVTTSKSIPKVVTTIVRLIMLLIMESNFPDQGVKRT